MNKLIIFLIFFIGLFSYKQNTVQVKPSRPYVIEEETEIVSHPKEEEEETITQEYSNIVQLNISKLKSVAKSKDGKKIMILTGTTCGYCKAYKPLLNDVLKQYNLKAYEIDTWKLTSPERDELIDIVGNDSGVPHTYIIDSGTVLDSVVGYQDTEQIVEMLKNNGFIN